MALLRRLFLIPDGVPAPLRGAVAALTVLVAVLWPLTLLSAGTSTAVLVVVSVLSVLALFALAAALLRRRYPGAHR